MVKARIIDSLSALLDVVGVGTYHIRLTAPSLLPRRLFRGQAVERPLLPRFAREAANRATRDVLETERRLLDDFSRLALPHIGPARPQTPYEWLAVAQHYGVPTRLLDWTGNPLFALWFAVREKPKGPFGSFWVLRVIQNHLLPLDAPIDVYGLKRTFLFRPAHITQRIVAQDGWFTVHLYIADKAKFIPLETQPRFKDHLDVYRIPSAAFPKLQWDLQRLGISPHCRWSSGPVCRSVVDSSGARAGQDRRRWDG